jgi:hypothetical protein
MKKMPFNYLQKLAAKSSLTHEKLLSLWGYCINYYDNPGPYELLHTIVSEVQENNDSALDSLKVYLDGTYKLEFDAELIETIIWWENAHQTENGWE